MIDSGKALTMDNEGYDEGVYLDSEQHPTCGYGYCLDPVGKFRTVKDWHLYKFNEKYSEAEAIYETYDFGLDDIRRAAVCDLLYNLGPVKFAKFVRFIAALRMKDWLSAAANLENSTWFKQVGRRGPRICRLLKEGRWDVL